MLVDSHCHLDRLDLERLGLTMDEVIAHAASQGVTQILSVGIDLETAADVIAIAEQYPAVYASVGLHPSEQVEIEPDKAAYLQLACHEKVIAIGEMGLDYYYNDTGLENQRDRFARQIQVARELNKPIIVHTRDAQEDTIAIMRTEQADAVGGVMHCFTESVAMARQALDLGFYISFSGIVTFKNAENVREVARMVPMDRLLVETDSPYLTPVPLRGKPNQPANVKHVADFLADFRGESVAELVASTTRNFQRLFSLASPAA